MISDNDFRWFAARLSIAVEDIRRSGGMSVNEMKQALRDIPGAEGLTVSYAPSGNQLITIAGRTVEVAPTASNAEIALAFREPAMSTPNVTVTATPIPAVTLTPPAPTQPQSKSMTTPAPGSFAASLKALLDEGRAGVEQAKADGHAKVRDALGKMHEAKTAVAHVTNNMAQTIHDEAHSVLSELGQISNDLGLD